MQVFTVSDKLQVEVITEMERPYLVIRDLNLEGQIEDGRAYVQERGYRIVTSWY